MLVNFDSYDMALAGPVEIKTEKWRALVAYWILGLCNNYGYVVMLSAALDILTEIDDEEDYDKVTTTATSELKRPCNLDSTGAILLANIIPALVVKLTAPFLPFFVHVRIALVLVLFAAGLILVAFATSKWIAIAGVVSVSLAAGLGEATLLQYSSFYDKNVVSSWSSGTGAAGLLGATSYAGLIKFGSRNANLIMLFAPVLMGFAFWIMLPKPHMSNSQYILVRAERFSTTKKDTACKAFGKKLQLLPGLMKYIIPLLLVYMFEYFINQGLFELIQFENTLITFLEQYHWYNVDYQVGVFVSRSSVNFFHIKPVWIMCILQFGNVLLFLCEAIFYYIPSMWIIFGLILWEGLLGGAAYVNTFYKISHEVPEETKQFSLSATSIADTVGITFAGILAIPVHNIICQLPKPTRRTFHI